MNFCSRCSLGLGLLFPKYYLIFHSEFPKILLYYSLRVDPLFHPSHRHSPTLPASTHPTHTLPLSHLPPCQLPPIPHTLSRLPPTQNVHPSPSPFISTHPPTPPTSTYPHSPTSSFPSTSLPVECQLTVVVCTLFRCLQFFIHTLSYATTLRPRVLLWRHAHSTLTGMTPMRRGDACHLPLVKSTTPLIRLLHPLILFCLYVCTNVCMCMYVRMHLQTDLLTPCIGY